MEKALSLRKDHSSTYYELGRALLEEGVLSEAEKKLSQAVKMEGENVNYLLAFTDAQVKRKKYDGALKSVLKAVRLEPENSKVIFAVCNVYRKKGYYTVAIGHCEKALDLNTKNPKINNRLAWLYAKKRVNVDRGMELIQRTLKEYPNRPGYIDTLSELYYVQGKVDEAVENIRVAIKIKPDEAYYKQQLWKFKNVAPKNLVPPVEKKES